MPAALPSVIPAVPAATQQEGGGWVHGRQAAGWAANLPSGPTELVDMAQVCQCWGACPFTPLCGLWCGPTLCSLTLLGRQGSLAQLRKESRELFWRLQVLAQTDSVALAYWLSKSVAQKLFICDLTGLTLCFFLPKLCPRG